MEKEGVVTEGTGVDGWKLDKSTPSTRGQDVELDTEKGAR